MARARETDPARFARLASDLLVREGIDPQTLDAVLETSMPRPRTGSKVPTLTTARRQETESRVVGPAAHPYGDCADVDEYARFRVMPPITRDEIDGLDWDALLEDLFED